MQDIERQRKEAERALKQEFQRLRDAINETREHANSIGRQVSEVQQEMRFNNLVEAEKEIVAYSIEKSHTYTRGVVFGGYAAFFATWAFTKSLLDDWEVLLSVLSMVISVAAFVSYEVFKMISSSRAFAQIGSKIHADPANTQAIREEWLQQQRMRVFKAQPIWYVALCVTIGFALIGTGILIEGFVSHLLSVYPNVWPFGGEGGGK